MKLLLLNGSLRKGSVNGAALHTVCQIVPTCIQAEMDQHMGQLPPFNPDDNEAPPQMVSHLRQAISLSDAILICTPEYAGAIPGAFKNLLEWTVGSTVMTGKPVAWINVSTAPLGARHALASLRIVLGRINALIVDEACLHIPVSRNAILADGLIHDEVIRTQLGLSVNRLLSSAKK